MCIEKFLALLTITKFYEQMFLSHGWVVNVQRFVESVAGNGGVAGRGEQICPWCGGVAEVEPMPNTSGADYHESVARRGGTRSNGRGSEGDQTSKMLDPIYLNSRTESQVVSDVTRSRSDINTGFDYSEYEYDD